MAIPAETRLTTVFNHRYDQNIPRLEAMYAERFPGLLHLVPFYDGDRSNVIPVYANPQHYQGFFAQTVERVHSNRYRHYAFVGDDLLLHPKLTSITLSAELGLDSSSAYIKELRPLGNLPFRWQPLFLGITPFAAPPGIDLDSTLPDVEVARRAIARHVELRETLTFRNLRDWHGRWHFFDRYSLRGMRHLLRAGGRLQLPYPLVMGFSDLVIVPAASLRRFARLCGIFAAMGVFVEVAIATALALSCEKIVTECSSSWRGTEAWDDEREELENRFGRRLKELLSSFGDRELYVHPVKLSRWSDD